VGVSDGRLTRAGNAVMSGKVEIQSKTEGVCRIRLSAPLPSENVGLPEQNTPRGGLEPPTFRLTAERSARHLTGYLGNFDVNSGQSIRLCTESFLSADCDCNYFAAESVLRRQSDHISTPPPLSIPETLPHKETSTNLSAIISA
jgi:hypothetical protein